MPEQVRLKIWSATSLARLLAEQGRRATRQRPARSGLCLFHRGFETADLKDAKVFLDKVWLTRSGFDAVDGSPPREQRELRRINGRRAMGQVVVLGLDIAKSVFQVHGVDRDGAVVG